uniref:Col_cuticle_N domain-containing protein n=1 Tax=Caenorhabditis tropicalis TaxID=1561998 RepID=A0A1I7T338_9PELO
MAPNASTIAPKAIKTSTELFNNVIISIENYRETQTWFLVLVGVTTLLMSIFCGIWCLLAAKNVKEDGTISFDDDDHDRSRGSRSTAGSDFSDIEMGAENVEESSPIKNYFTGVSH